MRKTSYFFLLSSFLFTIQNAASQEINISSQVVVFDSIPIVGAKVLIKGSKKAILTDSLGKFEAIVLPSDKLVISAEGFYSQKIKVDGNKISKTTNLKMKSGEKYRSLAMNQGHFSNSEKFMSAWLLNSEKGSDYSQFTTFIKLLEGKFPNVEISSGEILIRGGGRSLSSSSGALIVVDGSPSSFSALSSLSPANIKSVEIVTGAPAIRYGPGAGNGVLVIVTKSVDN